MSEVTLTPDADIRAAGAHETNGVAPAAPPKTWDQLLDETAPPPLSPARLADSNWVILNRELLERDYAGKWIVVYEREVIAVGDRASEAGALADAVLDARGAPNEPISVAYIPLPWDGH